MQDNITSLSAQALSAAIHARALSCREVMQAYLARIHRLNPVFNAIIHLAQEDDLLAQAEARDAQLARGETMGWLHGIPHAIKNTAHVLGFPSDFGCPLLEGVMPQQDQLMTARIKAAGAFQYWGLTAANYLSVGQSSTGDAFVKNAYPSKSLILGAGNTDHVVINAAGAVGAGGANFGAAGQVLTSAGSAAPPGWQTLPEEFASGTRLLFQQTAAPTGWTKDTTHNDKALRVVNGAVSSGGTVAFTSAFISQAVSGTVGSTTLVESQIPSHTHTHRGYVSVKGGSAWPNSGGGGGATISTSGLTTTATGGGGSHNHSFATNSINLAVQYVDVIIATKN